MARKHRFYLYFSVLICGILLNFWVKHDLEIIQFCRDTLQPAVEMQRRYALRDQNIVLSLTTTPYRIDKLRPVLDSLYKQNIKISNIYLNLPYVFKRNNIPYQIPEWLQNESRVTIIRSEDYGPATKLLGTLQNVKLPANTIIITVDDDMYYPSNLVLHLAYDAKINPHSAVTLVGGDLAYDKNGKPRTSGLGFDLRFEPSVPVTAIMGYAGVAYRPEFFDEQIYALDKAPQECYMHDDLYISFHLARRAVPRKNLSTRYVTEEEIKTNYEIARQPQALYILTPNRANLSNVCLAHLRAIYPKVTF